MQRFLKNILISLLFSVAFFIPTPAFAHAFGTQYIVPIPFAAYFWGAAITLVVSFIIIGVFIRQTKKDLSFSKINLSHSVLQELIDSKTFLMSIKIISVFLLFLTIMTGIFGVEDFDSNFSMIFFWIIFLLGITYSSAIFGNIYVLFNPFESIVNFISYTTHIKSEGFIKYPKQLSFIPALLFYYLLVWNELLGEVTPYKLGVLILTYTIITICGAFIFGKKIWFEKADFFSVFFKIISYISPFYLEYNKLFLRFPFIGLLQKSIDSFSLLLFILFMLSSTAFDGFRETLVWGNVSTFLYNNLYPYFGLQSDIIVSTFVLALSPFAFLFLYYLILFLMKLIVKINLSVTKLAFNFALSLIPIALVYNISHYYTMLVLEGQAIIRIISDPFGLGWNIFATSDFVPNAKLLPPNFIWQTEVGFLLLGHIVAVYLAHLIALRVFSSHKKAISSQFPMLFLMVGYTVFGLWLLSQPLSVGR